MVDLATVDQLAIERLRAWFAANHPTVGVEYPNERAPSPDADKRWCRAYIEAGAADPLNLHSGGGDNRQLSLLVVQVFEPVGGIQSANAFAWSLLRHFNGQEAGGVSYGAFEGFSPAVKHVGREDRGWHQVNVLIPFVAEELS